MEVTPGLVAIAGGKLTTYRCYGPYAVDAALGKQAAAERPSVTKDTPLLGADGYQAVVNRRGGDRGTLRLDAGAGRVAE